EPLALELRAQRVEDLRLKLRTATAVDHLRAILGDRIAHLRAHLRYDEAVEIAAAPVAVHLVDIRAVNAVNDGHVKVNNLTIRGDGANRAVRRHARLLLARQRDALLANVVNDHQVDEGHDPAQAGLE